MGQIFEADLSKSYLLEGLSAIDSGFFIYRADNTGELVFANASVLNIYDCESEEDFRELTDGTFKGMIFPADLRITEANISSQMAEKQGFSKVSFRIRSHSGIIKYVDIQGRFYNSKKEGQLVVVTMNVNRTDLKAVDLGVAGMNLELSGREYVLNTIDQAVRDNYIKIYYQPKFITTSGKLCGYEALSRWVDPKYGMLLPGQFVPILEEYKLTYILDRFVMRQIARDIVSGKIDCSNKAPISFNLSHNDFLTFDPCEELIRITEEYSLPRDYFFIEISETTLNSDPELFKREIRRLRDNGFHILIDDFGNEHSSLNTMREYEFDGLLIDIGYMENFDIKSRSMLKPIINMSKSLGIHTLAKGIETEEQLEFLKSVGCEIIQGYYYDYGKPSDHTPVEVSHDLDDTYADKSTLEADVRKFDKYETFTDDEDLTEEQKTFYAISSIYNSIYLLDLSTDSYKELKTTYALHRFLGESGRISDVMPAIMRTFTTSEYMSAIMNFTNPATLIERLADKDYIEMDFVGAMNGWTTAAFFTLSRDHDGHADKVLYTTRIIDKSKKTEMEYKDVLFDMSKIYFGLIHIIFKNHEFIPLIMTDYMKDMLGMNQQPYELAKEMFIKTYVSEEYQEKVNHFMDVATMPDRMKGNTFISMEYLGSDKKWFRILIAASKTDENGNALRASLAIEDINREKNEQAILQFKIEHDALTGVLNRTAYDKYTEILKNTDMAIAYILLDVDRFKQINDTYGHGMGDLVLKWLASYLRKEFRLSDHIIRMGGDEFCIIMTGIEDKDTQMLVDKICAINQALKNPDSDIPKVSISAGIAFSPQGFTNDLYEKADIALYHTKNTTRDGYTIYDDCLEPDYVFRNGQA
ncbi:bifunctional diguanylate cyclase/phosphodiesterase [Oribacterium sp. WCC10]|uniref:bifunctional diguanylate cyclase/phosphodiesterase n=1 Tax=Oribacterium sp. WCC10 TaxID=1855343 RepID=UPI0008E2E9AD|nr:GGDEF domain-containing protein [Oribacterium sp. WCC10]SFG45551.1 diguanylate cyclase (GGDEF) domain-containing protein [Oribacterium sp. WCC10]